MMCIFFWVRWGEKLKFPECTLKLQGNEERENAGGVGGDTGINNSKEKKSLSWETDHTWVCSCWFFPWEYFSPRR